MSKINDTKRRKPDELFLLVKSLNKAEVVRIKNFWQTHTRKSEVLHNRLLDIILECENFAEASLLKKLGINTKAQLSALKKKLFRDIMQQCSVTTAFSQSYLPEVGSLLFLINRGLFKSAKQFLCDHKVAAYKKGDFNKYIHLLRFEYDCLDYFYPYSLSKHQALQRQVLSQAINMRWQFDKASELLREILRLKDESNNRVTPDELEETNEQYKELKQLKLSANAHPVIQIIYKTCNALIAYLRHDDRGSSHFNKLIINDWEAHPYLINDFSRIFFASATTAFYNKFARQNLTAIVALLGRYNQLAKSLQDDGNKARWDIIHYHTLNKYYHKKREYDALKELLKKNMHLLQKAKQLFPTRSYFPYLTTDIITWFVLEDYKKADEALYQLKTLNRDNLRKDVYFFSMLFHLLVMFELKDWYRLFINIDAAYKQLYNQKKQRPFEKEVMLFLKKFVSLHNSADVPAEVKRFMQKLSVYKNDPVKKQYFLYFDYYSWFESKLQNMSYRSYQVLKNKIPV